MKISNILECHMLVFLTSCVSVDGLYTGYEHLTEKQKGCVVKYEGNIDQLQNDGKVYKITVKQLKQYIDKLPLVLIYDYKPKCTGDACVNPTVIETDCQQHGCQFCLVACDLDGIFDTPELQSPMLFMDNSPYGTRVQQKYERWFLEELTGHTYKERGYGRYMMFRNGQFAGAYNNYADAFQLPSVR